MSPGRRARSGNWGTCMTMSSTARRKPRPSTGKRRTSMSKSATWRTKAGRGTISPVALRKLRRLDEARQEIRRAIECNAQFGHASEPWTTWAILADIETDAGNPTAAAEAKRQGHRLLPRLPPRRRREPRRRSAASPRRDPVPARRRPGRRRVPPPATRRPSRRRAASAPSSAPSKPSSPAAATAPSPTPRIWTTRWPPKSSS